jgi:hypothetical protein
MIYIRTKISVRIEKNAALLLFCPKFFEDIMYRNACDLPPHPFLRSLSYLGLLRAALLCISLRHAQPQKYLVPLRNAACTATAFAASQMIKARITSAFH